MAYAVLQELQAPTGVDAAVWVPLLPCPNGSPHTHTHAAVGSPPSMPGVPLARASSFTSSIHDSSAQKAEMQLATARGPVLDVFRLVPFHTRTHTPSEEGPPSVIDTHTPYLQLLTSTRFPENIASLCAIPLHGVAAHAVAGAEEIHALVVTFAPGRVSVLVLDALTLSLQTVAMLNFEEDALGAGSSVRARRRYANASGLAGLGWTVMDPQQRALALLVYDEQLAIIPLRRRTLGGMLDEEDREADAVATMPTAGAAAAQQAAATSLEAALEEASAEAVKRMDGLTAQVLRAPFILDIADASSVQPPSTAVPAAASSASGDEPAPLAGTVRDIAFCHGYQVEPALAVLTERYATSAARLASLAHTCTLSVASLDMTHRQGSILWRYDGLPHDCFAVIPVPPPFGGVVVLSSNAVLYLNQFQAYALAVNAFAAYTVDAKGACRFDTNSSFDTNAEQVCISLDAARGVFVSPTQLLVSLRDGALYLITLHAGASNSVHHMTIGSTGWCAPPASCLAALQAEEEVNDQLCENAAFGLSAYKHASHSFGLLMLGSRLGDAVLGLFRLTLGGQEDRASSIAARTTYRIEDEDAELYGVGEQAAQAGTKRSRGDVEPDAVGQEHDSAAVTSKRPHMANDERNTATAGAIDDEDALFYGTGAAAKDEHAGTAAAKTEPAEGDDTRTAADRQAEDAPPVAPVLDLYVIDSLPNLGRSTDCTVLRETQLPLPDDDTLPAGAAPAALVVAGGRDSTGAVATVTQALRPIVTTDVRLPNVCGAWFMNLRTHAHDVDGDSASDDAPSLLLLAVEGQKARVFSTRDGVSELAADETDLLTTGATTVTAGVVLRRGTSIPPGVLDAGATDPQIADGANMRIVQAHTKGVRVLAAVAPYACTQEIAVELPLDVGGLEAPRDHTVVAAVVSDPYVLLRLSDGSVRVLVADATGDLAVSRPSALDGVAVTAVTLISDASRCWAAALGGEADEQSTMLAVVCARDGWLRMFALPSWRLIFACADAHAGTDVLHQQVRSAIPRKSVSRVYIREVAAVTAASDGTMALVLLTSVGDVLGYILHGATSVTATGERSAGTGSVRLHAGPRFVRALESCSRVARGAAAEEPGELYTKHQYQVLTPFENCGGWSGAACLTGTPCWIMLNRGGLHAIPMSVSDIAGTAGPAALPGDMLFGARIVRAFAPFHSDACPNGMIWAHQGVIQFCELPSPAWPGTPDREPRRLMAGALYRTDGAAVLVAPSSSVQIACCAQAQQADAQAAAPPLLPAVDIADVRMHTAPSGATCLFRKQPLFCTVQRVAALPVSSGTAGSEYVHEWLAQRPAVPKPSAAVVDGCVHALTAVAVATMRPRDHAADFGELMADLARQGGEHAQMDYGPHIEYAALPMETSTDPAISRVATAVAAAGLDAPPTWDYDHSIRLYEAAGVASPLAQWVLHDELHLAKNERILCMAELSLVDAPGQRGVGSLLVGTGVASIRGEDGMASGRLIVLRISRTRAPDGSSVRFSWQQLHSMATDLPVTAISSMTSKGNQYVLYGEGRTLHVCTWSRAPRHHAAVRMEGPLEERFPYRAHLWIRDIACIAEFVVVADMYSSARFLQWRHEDGTLRELARDASPLHPACLDLFRYEGTLGVVIADEARNLQILAYAPKETFNRLAVRGDVHVGHGIMKLIRERVAMPPSTTGARRQVLGLTYASHEGAIGILVPVDEITFKRLLTVQQLLTYSVPHPGGTNPKQARLFANPLDPERPRVRNILDGGLLARFMGLSTRLQRAMAKGMGSSVERILDNLRVLQLSAMVW